MISTILPSGRHRFGRPGSIPVRSFVVVKQRNFFARLFGIGYRPGKHARPDAAVIDLRRSTAGEGSVHAAAA